MDEEKNISDFETTSMHLPVKHSTKDLARDMLRQNHRSILVLINPHSGRGRSVKIFKKAIEPQLKANSLKYDVFITEANYRVKDKIKSMSPDELDTLNSLLVVSGDGLVHEVINSIMARDDWRDYIGIPISVVPTGSGNGLAYTLIRRRHPQLNDKREAIKLCCEQAIQDIVTHSDLIKISFGSSPKSTKTYYSFLSIGWGLMADIDIDSEWLRRLGDLRFTFYGLLRSITSVPYKGTLSYKPTITSIAIQSGTGKDLALLDEWVHIEDIFACLYAVYLSHIASNTEFSPKSTMTDKTIYLTIVRGKLSPRKVIEFLLAIQDGSHEKLPYVQVIPVTTFKFQPLETSKVVVDGEVIPWSLNDGTITVEIIPERLTLKWNFDE